MDSGLASVNSTVNTINWVEDESVSSEDISVASLTIQDSGAS